MSGWLRVFGAGTVPNGITPDDMRPASGPVAVVADEPISPPSPIPSQHMRPKLTEQVATYRVEVCVSVPIRDGDTAHRALFTAPCPSQLSKTYAAVVTRLELAWFSCVTPGACVRLRLVNRRSRNTAVAVAAADGSDITTNDYTYAFPTAPFSRELRASLFFEDKDTVKTLASEARFGRWRDADQLFDACTQLGADGVYNMRPGDNYLRDVASAYHIGPQSLPSPNSFTADERAAAVAAINAAVFTKMRAYRLYPRELTGEVEVWFDSPAAVRPATVAVRMLLNVEVSLFV